jgi:predicted GNAT family N-acyltransferase
MEIFISLPAQTLELFGDDGLLLARYAVSTALKGAGEMSGSFCTPRGRHQIRAKIGQGCAPNTVFVRRRPTGESWSPALAAQSPGRDWILTRILWLSGCEPGRNRLGCVDTMRRYIYLHGCPDDAPMGVPGSIGCVRMRNRDIIELFDRVAVHTPLEIAEYRLLTGDWPALATGARAVREAVFVEEKGIAPALEWDALDAGCRHVVAVDAAGQALGTGRLLMDGRIGRVAVLSDWRGQRVGGNLLRRLLEAARQLGLPQVYLHARADSTAFYERFGFVAEGAPFMETGTPHRRMWRRL